MLRPPRSLLTAAVTLLAVAALEGCSPGRLAPDPADRQPSRGAPAIGSVRREAWRASEPGRPLELPVRAGARRAVLHVAAARRTWTPLAGLARAHARATAVDAAGATLALDENGLLVCARQDGAWTRLALDLPSGTERLRLEVRPGRAGEVWWSVRFEGLAPPAARNVLLVSLDTVRADAVSAWGQPVLTTPHLDALAARGTRFARCVAPSSWTMPSHASVMTGVLPSWHGRTHRGAGGSPPRALPTLARLLGDAGWETAAFTGAGYVSWTFGATQDFSLVVEHPSTREDRWWRAPDVPEARVGAAAAIRWLEDRRAFGTTAPFFLFWHTYEPHAPYTEGRFEGTAAPLPAGVAEGARSQWLRYLGDVAVADEALGELLAALDRLGLADATDVIVLSDHGEELGEHSDGRLGDRRRHGHGSWETLLHVPLVVASPTLAPGVRDDLVSLVDVFPTVLAAAGVPLPGASPPPPGAGRPLQVPGGHAEVFAEALHAPYAEGREEKVVRTAGGLKGVVTLRRGGRRFVLRDLARDPRELEDASVDGPDVAAALERRLDLVFGGAPADTAALGGLRDAGDAGAEALGPEEREALRALGYVH